MENDGLAQGRGGMSDPGSGPVPLRWVGLDGRLRLQSQGAESEGEEGKKLAQGIGPFVRQTSLEQLCEVSVPDLVER